MATTDTVTKWLKGCEQNHNECDTELGYLTLMKELPTRILCLESDRVVLQEYPSWKPAYACVSHCWGSGMEIPITTSVNLESRQQEVFESSLTKTFSDAVETCRRLQVQYLWIDSLCIIQDSDSDWQRESAKMAGIYRGGVLAIAAAKAVDGSHGCFAEVASEYLSKPIPGTTAYVRLKPRTLSDAWRSPEAWPILARGWCYQEFRMSRRTIYFGQQEVTWQCRHERRSESACDNQLLDTIRMFPQHPQFGDRSSHVDRWHRIVMQYSEKSLTFPKDRFPALAAIVKEEMIFRSEPYLAGLWEMTLLHDICWCIAEARNRPVSSLASSWSWVSVSSGVSWHAPYKNFWSIAKAEKWQYVFDGHRHMPTVKEAVLSMNAPLLSIKNVGKEPLDTNIISIPGGPDRTIKVFPNYMLDSLEDYETAMHRQMIVAIIGVHLSYSYMLCYIGLVLQPIHNTLVVKEPGAECKDERFRRIGYVSLERTHYHDVLPKSQTHGEILPTRLLMVEAMKNYKRQSFLLM